MTKPLSMFLKTPEQSGNAGFELEPVRRAEPEPVQTAHIEPERTVVPAEKAVAAKPVPAAQATAKPVSDGAEEWIAPLTDPALLAAEPMMTTPAALKAVPVEPVLVKFAVSAAKSAAERHGQTAAAAVDVPEKATVTAAVVAVPKMVATAKIAANRYLSNLFKPAINVKPSVFVAAKKHAASAEAAESVTETAEQNIQTASANEAVSDPARAVAEVTQQPVVAETAEAAAPVVVEAVAEAEAPAASVAAAETAEVEESLSVQAVTETIEEPVAFAAVEETAAVQAQSVSDRAAEKLAVAAAAYAAVQTEQASRGKAVLPKLPKIAVPKISMPKVSVPKVSKANVAVFKTAVKPIQAAVVAISTVPALAAAGRFWQNKPVRWSILGALLPVSGMVAAYAVTDPRPQAELYRVERVMEELPPVYVESGTFQGSYWAQEAVEPGDSLTDVLQRMGVSESNIREVLARNSVDRSMIQLRAGQSINVRFDASGDITDVQFFNDDDNGERNLVAIEKVNGKWQASSSSVEMEIMPTLRSVQVRTSARGAMAQAGVPVEIRESLSEIFTNIVNVEELAAGDSIRLLYNSMYFRGQEMATGDILAAEVVKNGKLYRAYYYSQGKGDEESGSYYDQNGKSLRLQEGFNVKPVDYVRMSSPYGLRVHPVLRTVKMHTGIDYAAPAGTPIRAPADGVLTFKGWRGGYGNAVIIQHSNGIETLYAHMSGFSTAQGQVKAGEVIGYVGSTGRSTGPHLHYEVRKNGQHMNPTAIALPTPKLTPANMAEFRKQQQAYAATMTAVRNLPVTVTQLD